MQKNSQCLLKAGSYTQHVVVICYPNRVSSMLHVCCLLIMLVWMQWYIGSNRLTTTAEMRVKCSPRWIVYHNRHSVGAQQLGGVTTQQECLKRCANNPNCIAVDWNTPLRQCGLHNTTNSQYSTHYYSGDVTQFEIVRGCETASGIVTFHSLRTVIVTASLSGNSYSYSIICFQLHVQPEN